jgi:hypothetical protein
VNLETLLSKMWLDYCNFNPSAYQIYKLLSSVENTILNDHIALRTFCHPKLGLEHMANVFKSLGYREKKDYHFKEKCLYAKHYEHIDSTQPKLFISELLVDKLSASAQEAIEQLVQQIPESIIQSQDFCYSGRSWKLSHKTYEMLLSESEYAAWVASIGFRPNHFTVFVNHLNTFKNIEQINNFLENHNFSLNTSGGKIKGTPAELLEQSSTMAESVSVDFDEGVFNVPACFYEFAYRYPDTNGNLYQGFIAASADKIFESTFKKKEN